MTHRLAICRHLVCGTLCPSGALAAPVPPGPGKGLEVPALPLESSAAAAVCICVCVCACASLGTSAPKHACPSHGKNLSPPVTVAVCMPGHGTLLRLASEQTSSWGWGWGRAWEGQSRRQEVNGHKGTRQDPN